jgi:Spy/CpxP family protein refolding chaperone
MKRLVLVLAFAAAASLGAPHMVSAQGPGGRGGFGGGDQSLMLLGDENVQKDLEIVDSQKEKLDALRDRVRDEMRALFQGGGGGDREAMREKMQEKMTELQKEADQILLPHQRERLKQISIQSRLRFGNTSDAVGNALQLTDEQKEALRTKERQVNAEMQKEITKIRDKYRDQLLEVLTPEQRAKWKELVGTPIEFGQPQFGGGPRGQRGGQGNRPDNNN